MKYPETKNKGIPKKITYKWQEIVNTIADLLDVPAALIMKANPPYIEVFRASKNSENPYKVGARKKLAGLYHEEVILSGEKLKVTNALKDEKWKDNPDVEHGMISYLGFPIKWSDGDVFGILCILDSKENQFSGKAENLLKNFRELIETHLELNDKNSKLKDKKKKLSITLQSIGDAVITTTPQGTINRMNKKAEKLTGWKYEKAKGKKLKEVFNIVNANTGEHAKDPVEKVMESGEIEGLANDTTLIAKDGTKRQIADSASPIRDDNGDMLGIILVFRDVTEKYKMEQKIKEENKWLSVLYNNTEDPIVIIDKNHCVIDINYAFNEKFGYRKSEIEGMNLDQILNKSKEEFVDNDLTSKLLSGEEVKKEETRYDKEGNPIECIVKDIPVMVDSEMIGAYVIYNDITERKKQEEEVKYISFHDNLTDLYNREFLETEIERLNVERQLPLSMIMLDLNGLKLINDTYGHKIGDKLLTKTAKVLKNIFRKEDIIARWGGDEFVILLNQTTEEVNIKLANRIKKLDKEVKVSENEKIPLSLAVGYAVKKDKPKDMYDLFQEAEDMMYRDKLLEKESVKSHIINTLLVSLREKSLETEEHTSNIKELAIKLGEKIDLSKSELNRLSSLALLHDIGMTIVPEDILNKPDQLNKEEWEQIKKHPGAGYRICSEVEEFSHFSQEILAHQEFWNGEGYPKGLKGDKIPLLARIISIVDAYDVMIHDRPYKKAISKEKALKELDRLKGKQFDPDLAEKFIGIIFEEEFAGKYNNKEELLKVN